MKRLRSSRRFVSDKLSCLDKQREKEREREKKRKRARERERDRQTDRQTERHRQIERERAIEGQSERYISKRRKRKEKEIELSGFKEDRNANSENEVKEGKVDTEN